MQKGVVVNMNEKEKRNLLIGMLLTGIIAFLSLALLTKNLEQSDDLMVSTLPTDGTPLLVLQSKVGDDTVPHIHQTWCQLLPYKRYIGDDQVFCYVEVIDDWSVD